jgi:hypothetical protein
MSTGARGHSGPTTKPEPFVNRAQDNVTRNAKDKPIRHGPCRCQRRGVILHDSPDVRPEKPGSARHLPSAYSLRRGTDRAARTQLSPVPMKPMIAHAVETRMPEVPPVRRARPAPEPEPWADSARVYGIAKFGRASAGSLRA